MMAWIGMFATYNLLAATETGVASNADPVPGNGSTTPMSDIHDIKPALDMGPDMYGLYWIIVLLVLAGFFFMLWRWWRGRKKGETAIPVVPSVAPDVEAYEKLKLLADNKNLSSKKFYFQLSGILRHYMERRFGFPAAEMTTEELLPRVDQLSLEGSLDRQFKRFCRTSDPIKFASASADPDQLSRDLLFAEDFVRQTTEAMLVAEKGAGELSITS